VMKFIQISNKNKCICSLFYISCPFSLEFRPNGRIRRCRCAWKSRVPDPARSACAIWQDLVISFGARTTTSSCKDLVV
jgi:hypothetical protein